MNKVQLLLIIYSVTSTTSGKRIDYCEFLDNTTCDCEDDQDAVVRVAEIYCPQKNNVKFKVTVDLFFDEVDVTCDKTILNDYEVKSSINLSWLDRLTPWDFFCRNCVIPPNGFELFKVCEKTDKLHFNECVPSDHVFRREHFNGLGVLGSLVIRSAEALTLSPNTFEYLPNITTLYLELPNLRDDLIGELFRSQQKLGILTLERTPTNLTKELFSHLSSIDELHIRKCVLHENTPRHDAFEWLHNVVHVEMVANRLTTLPSGLFHSNKQLGTLTIMEPDLKKQPDDLLVNLKHLIEFTLSNTSIETIHVDYFEKTRKLSSIDMSYNKLTSLPDGVFRNLVRLRTINLENNKIIKLPSTLISQSWSIESMNLRNNYLKTYPALPNLQTNFKTFDLSHNQIERISWDDFKFDSSTSINLTNNLITTIDFADYYPHEFHAPYTSEFKMKELHLDGNPFNCDCGLIDFTMYMEDPYQLKKFRIVGGECSTPSHLAKQRLSQIDFNAIVRQTSNFSTVFCSEQCDCNFRRVDYTLVMNCTKEGLRQLRRFPNTGLWYKYATQFGRFPNTVLWYKYVELNFANQNVTEFPNLNLVPGLMESVIYVNASNNNIQHFSRAKFTNYLRWLDLSNNNLVSLDEDLIELWNASEILEKLWLSGNPWTCNCDETRPMQQFIFSNAIKVPNYREITCENKAGKRLHETDLCRDRNITIIALCSSAFVVALLFTFYYKYRELINVWLYGTFGRSIGKYLTEKPFDAFISFAEPDSDYVMNQLAPALEDGPENYRLCIHTRDWIAAPIIEQIYESVYNSRYTIIVLSENFLRSEWGIAEFRAAQIQANDEKRSNVIMVMYGGISDNDVKDSAAELQAYLRANTYLKWDEPWFLKKLRYSLRRSRRDGKIRTHDDTAIEMTPQRIE